jgi:hypothetical protein
MSEQAPSQETREYIANQFKRIDANARSIASEHRNIVGMVHTSSVEVIPGKHELIASVIGHPKLIMDMLHLSIDVGVKAIFINVVLDGDDSRINDENVKLAYDMFKVQLMNALATNAKGDFIENLKAKLGDADIDRSNADFN